MRECSFLKITIQFTKPSLFLNVGCFKCFRIHEIHEKWTTSTFKPFRKLRHKYFANILCIPCINGIFLSVCFDSYPISLNMAILRWPSFLFEARADLIRQPIWPIRRQIFNTDPCPIKLCRPFIGGWKPQQWGSLAGNRSHDQVWLVSAQRS